MKKGDIFDVYKDGVETFRAMATQNHTEGYSEVLVINLENLSTVSVNVENEVESILYNAFT